MPAPEVVSNSALPEILTRSEAAALLGIDESTLRLHEKSGRIEPAVIRAGESDKRKRAYHLKASVIVLKERLAHEALGRRTQQQADRDFDESLIDDAKRARLHELEDLGFEFELREARKLRETRQKEIAAEAAACAAEAERAQKIAELEREKRRLDREYRKEKLAADALTFNIIATATSALLLGLATWIGKASEGGATAASAQPPLPETTCGMSIEEGHALIKSIVRAE